MATQDKSYSLFISTKPYSNNASDANLKFVYLCSDPSFQYSLNYSGSTTGVLGQGPDKAIFVDGSSGAVGNISVSGTRCNPSTSITSSDGTEGYFITKSNAELYWITRSMLTDNQMFQGAYILRIYNVDWSSVSSVSDYKDMYVHISKFDMSFDWKTPNEVQISLSCIRRNKTKGFGDA